MKPLPAFHEYHTRAGYSLAALHRFAPPVRSALVRPTTHVGPAPPLSLSAVRHHHRHTPRRHPLSSPAYLDVAATPAGAAVVAAGSPQ